MSEPIIDEISSSVNDLITETGIPNGDEAAWLYRSM